MDVTPQLIEQIEFSEKFRGYDPDQVDDFLERVGASLSELLAENADLSTQVDVIQRSLEEVRSQPPRAVDAPAPAPARAAVPQMTDDEEIEQATRTLVLAKRTAEAAISEARAEATRMVADARGRAEGLLRDATTESERLVRDAQAQREDLVRRAREDAEAEFGSHRERFTAEISSLDSEKAALVGHVEALRSRVEQHRSDLTGTMERIRAVLDDPEALAGRPALSPETMAPRAEGAFFQAGATGVVAQASSERVSAESITVVDEVPEGAATDPWGPGSWSEVEGDEPSSADVGSPEPAIDASADSANEPLVGAPAVDGDSAEEVVASPFDDPAATQAHTFESTGQHDRYMQKLDDAVNAEPGDDKMSAFFEGDEPNGGRRFGRRR